MGSLAPPGGVGLVGCDAWLSRPLLLYSFSDFVDLRWGDSYYVIHRDYKCYLKCIGFLMMKVK